MVTKPFVAKVSRIVNNKKKGYTIYRMNVPNEVADELGLSDRDYLFVRAEKAQWYHFLDWKNMRMTWARLPNDIRKEIELSGIEREPEAIAERISTNWFRWVSQYMTTIEANRSYGGISTSGQTNFG
jgi:hypothetical protein